MVRLNESGWDESQFSEEFTDGSTRIERLIENTFEDSYRKCLNLFPHRYFQVKDFSSAQHEYDVSRGTGSVSLPSDFLLLYEFKMKGWLKSSYEAKEETEVESLIQSNDYVRGNMSRPKCTLKLFAGEGKLNYYSLRKGFKHVVETALYIPKPTDIRRIGDTDELNEQELLLVLVMWINASIVLTVLGKPDMAKMAEAKGMEII
jgi:hypothetical protein